MSVCESCRKTHHAAGSMLLYEDLTTKPVVLLSGMLASFNVSDDAGEGGSDDIVRFFITRGAFFNSDILWASDVRPGFELSGATCVTDCVVARIDRRAARFAFDSDPEVSRAVAQSLADSWLHLALCFSAVRSHGIYEGTRDLLLFLADKDVVLTHQQIARITNHNRPSTTKAIGELKRREPGVWARVAHVVGHARGAETTGCDTAAK